MASSKIFVRRIRSHDQPQLVVDEAHLQQVAQLVVVGQPGQVEAAAAVDARASGRCPPGGPAGRRADRATARAAAVRDESRRWAARAGAARRSSGAGARGARGPARRLSTPGRAGAPVGADPRRAQGRSRLHAHHPVAEPVHQVVHAGLVAADVGRRARARHAGVEDGGHGLEGGVVDRVAVAKPGGGPRQRGEVGKARGVDLASGLAARVSAGNSSNTTTTTGGLAIGGDRPGVLGASSPPRAQPAAPASATTSASSAKSRASTPGGM